VTKNETPPHPVGTRGRFLAISGFVNPVAFARHASRPRDCLRSRACRSWSGGRWGSFAFVDLVELDHALSCNL